MARVRHDLPLAAFALAGIAALAACGSGAPASSPLSPTTAVVTTVVDVPVTINVNAGRVGTWNWAGQSVTMPAGGRYDHLSFSWYDYGTRAGEPTAFGRLFVLTQEFTGLPGALGPTTPGYLGQSDAAPTGTGNGSQGQGTEYVFPADLTLEGGRQYWFYTDTQGAFATSFDEDVYPDGQLYVTGIATFPFHVAMASGHMGPDGYVPPPAGVTVDANFRLRAASK
jgi:hypothetical protein